MPYKLFYRDEGKGEPIVLIHGFLASSQYFKVLRKRLSTNHRVISIDLLGFGRSPKPDGCDYSYQDHTAALHATIEHLNLTRFTLIGHSLGALISLRYACEHPDAVQSLCLLNPPMYLSSEEAETIFRATGLHYRVLLHSRSQEALWAIGKLIPRFPTNRRRPSINLTDVMRPTQTSRSMTYRNVILHAKFFEDMKQLSTPCLLVVGKRDRPQYQQAIAAWDMPPLVTGLCVPAGHHLPTTHPFFTEHIIRTYLDRH